MKNGVLESNSYSSLQNIYSQCQTAQKAYDEKKLEHDMAETMECALKATMQAEYWRGQAEALKSVLCGEVVRLEANAEPEPEADGNV